MTTDADPLRAIIQPTAVHHVGIAVRRLEDSRAYYEQTLGGVWEGIEEVPSQSVRVALVRIGEGPSAVRLELLEPTADDSPVGKFIANRGPGMHHVAYAVEQLAARLEALEQAGVPLIDRVPRRGAHGMRIAFLHPRGTGGVLTELCEPAS